MNDKVILPLLRINLNKGVYNGHIHYIGNRYRGRSHTPLSPLTCQYKNLSSFVIYGRWEIFEIDGKKDKYLVTPDSIRVLPILRDWCIANQESIKNLFKKHHVSISELQENIFKEEKFYLLFEEIIYSSKKEVCGKRRECDIES